MAGLRDKRHGGAGRLEAAAMPLFPDTREDASPETLRDLRLTSRPSPVWGPHLTHRQRVLLYMEPLLRLYRQPGTRDERHLRYDTLSLAVKIFDVIIDQSGFGSEVTEESVVAAARPLLKATDEAQGRPPDPALHEEVVHRVLADLKNEANRQESFEVSYQAFDELGRPSPRTLRFKLLIEQFGYGGDIVLRLSSAAINLFLNAFGLDIEDAQVANEAVVQAQLERGRFNEAVHSAQNARGRSMQFDRKVRRLIAQASRDIDRVDWRGDVDRTLREASEHVKRRLDMEGDIRRSAEEKLDHLEEDDRNRPALAEVVRLVKDCQEMHLSLHERLMTARSQLLAQHARQAFSVARIRQAVDLRDAVLRGALSLERSAAAEAAGASAGALLGPMPPPVLSLRDLVPCQMAPKRQVGDGLADGDTVELDGGDEESEHRYSKEASDTATQRLASLRGETRLSHLIRGMAQAGDGAEAADVLVLQAFAAFGDEAAKGDVRVELAEAGALDELRHAGDDLWIIPCNREASDGHGA